MRQAERKFQRISESRTSIYFAIAGNAVTAAFKFFAAFVSGSSAMTSEGIHSLVDTSDGFFLLLGNKNSQKPADQRHPFGYGKELYFWTLIVALLIFALGGAMSIYQGIVHLIHPHPIENVFWNYLVLGVAFAAEGTSFLVALKAFRRNKREGSYWRAIRTSKDPTVFTVLFEDAAALVGLIIAFLGIFLGQLLNNPYLDGTASVLIGLTLAAVAIFLARESKDLLVGEGLRADHRQALESYILARPYVNRLEALRSLHFGPHEVMVVLNIKFNAEIESPSAPSWSNQIHDDIVSEFSDIQHVFVESEA